MAQRSTSNKLPRWDLTNVFPGLESYAFNQAVLDYRNDLTEMETYLDTHSVGETGELPTEPAVLAKVTAGYLQQMNQLLDNSRSKVIS